jgi:hypothetical protein
MLRVALPLASSVLVPRRVDPSLKVTVPAGVPAPGPTAATCAVKVTAWPETEGLAEELSAVVVPALFTVWVSAVGVLLLLKSVPPL